MTDLLITRMRHNAVIEPCSDRGSGFLKEQMSPPYVIQPEHVHDFKSTAEEQFGLEVELK